jgi:cell division protein FtsN
VSNSRQRLSARDYKNPGRGSPLLDLTRYRQFGAGLAVGLGVALLVWIYEHHVRPASADALAEVARPTTRTAKAASSAAADGVEPATEYRFYDMLPTYEVTVPELEQAPRRDQPSEPVTQPGVYVLQVGSYRDQPESAQRVRDKLAKLGIEASVQHVAIDEVDWYRVRIAAMSDLAKLNATRRLLQTADMDAVIFRVGD